MTVPGYTFGEADDPSWRGWAFKIRRLRSTPRRADREHDGHQDGNNCHHLEHAGEAQPCHEHTGGDRAKRVSDVVESYRHAMSGAVSARRVMSVMYALVAAVVIARPAA